MGLDIPWIGENVNGTCGRAGLPARWQRAGALRQEKERLCALLRFDGRCGRVFDGLAQHNPAIDRNHFKLDGEAVSVLVLPGGSDLVPEGLRPFLGDVPGQKVRGLGLVGGVVSRLWWKFEGGVISG